jgi:hypothetical protein
MVIFKKADLTIHLIQYKRLVLCHFQTVSWAFSLFHDLFSPEKTLAGRSFNVVLAMENEKFMRLESTNRVI